MKFEIFNEEQSTSLSTYLKLEKRDFGVCLTVCNENGKSQEGSLLVKITQEGKIHRYFGISKFLGFSLDKEGRIREDE